MNKYIIFMFIAFIIIYVHIIMEPANITKCHTIYNQNINKNNIDDPYLYNIDESDKKFPIDLYEDNYNTQQYKILNKYL